MASPREVQEAVARAIAREGILPSEISVLLEEADNEGSDADVDLPVLEITISNSERLRLTNTDFTGFVVDDNGNKVGKIFESEYQLTLDMSLWVPVDDDYNVDRLGEQLRESLYQYSDFGPGKDLLDEDGNSLDEVFKIVIGDGTRNDDLFMTPTIRRWQQEVELWSVDEFTTTEDYIVDVNYPASGEMNDDDNDDVIELDRR